MTRSCMARVSLVALLGLLLVACGGDSEKENETEIPAATADGAVDSDAPASESASALCLAHSAAADQCFICDASLREPGRLWCQGHARYEDRCFKCHPEIREEDRLYCEEHGLYEDECFLCHPELKTEESSVDPRETGEAVAAEDLNALYCWEHDVPEAECGICQPTLANGLKPGQGLKIRLPSTMSETKAKIVARSAQQGPTQSSVHAVGQLDFNQNRLARITPLTDGIVRNIFVDLGYEVKRGQVLAELSSPRIAEAQSALLKAVAEETVSSKTLSRERDLHQKKVSSAQDLYDAEARYATARASLRAAEQMLSDLGFDQPTLDRIVSEQKAESVLPLVAPFDGTVIARDAVVGDVVTMGDQLFSVADISMLWLGLAVSEKDIAQVRVGQRVDIRSQTLDREIAGRVTWISSQLNKTTRMAEVRAEVANPDRLLRAGVFVDATITVGESVASLLVPRDTVYRFDGNPFVFVRVEGDLYELRRVETLRASKELMAITAGLTDHDLVAVEQSYLLKSEFQKSRLGAGCVH